MPRTNPLDPDRVLTEAMELLWEKGFDATSIEEIEDRTGINRFRLHGMFGGRHQLLVAALRRYRETVLDRQLHELERSDDGIQAVRRFLDGVIDGFVAPGVRRGCLILSHAAEPSARDPEIDTAVRHGLDRQRKALRHALRRAVARGELRAGTDVPASADFLLTTARGLTVLGRSGAARSRLRRAARAALDALEGAAA